MGYPTHYLDVSFDYKVVYTVNPHTKHIRMCMCVQSILNRSYTLFHTKFKDCIVENANTEETS